MTKKNTYKAQPEELPKPTYWPFFLALGVVLIFWGILTSWIKLKPFDGLTDHSMDNYTKYTKDN
jgi:hypothetical protein